MIAERIAKIRSWMASHQLAAYIIPSTDPHLSEYVAPRWKSRQWISGFTGSMGTVVITMDKAGLWTDSRYFIQAEEQLANTGMVLYKAAQFETTQEIPEWLFSELPQGCTIGLDGHVFTTIEVETIAGRLAPKGISIESRFDAMEDLWEDRPSAPDSQVQIFDKKYVGVSAAARLQMIREEIAKLGANCTLISSLDEIAWALLVRGNDVKYTPVVISYLLLTTTDATFFIDPAKCSPEVAKALGDEGIKVRPYSEMLQAINELDDCEILLPPGRTSYAVFHAIPEKCKVIRKDSPVSWMRSVRTPREIEGLHDCMIQDGVAMVKFQRWLINAVQEGKTVTEVSLSHKLAEFRAERDLNLGESFATIAGYGPHAAIVHYTATEETDVALKPKGLLLLDSGGHYCNGTTDITRTFALGSLTEEEKIDYTCVVRGNISLALAKFPKGVNGTHLDALARLPLWERGMAYFHGTGHGVGYYLSVHEGTYQFRLDWRPQPLLLHSTITDEPGMYKEGKHGARTENVLLVVADQTTEYGEFYRFETLTLCPIDTEPIVKSLLTEREINWLNGYHKRVFMKLAPFLQPEEVKWLRDKCAEI